VTSKYQKAPAPGLNPRVRRKTESIAGIAGAIARERTYMRDREERGPRPKVSLPVLKFMTRPMPDWVEPPRPRRGRS
jgi:hypothetical protein